MASIRKRGESYLIVVSMGYDYNGKRIKPKQKTVHPPADLTPKQREKWLQEQAVLFERACRNDDEDSRSPDITLAKYIELWLEKVAPNRLAKSTVRRDRQDIARILPSLGHYRLRELRPEYFRSFYAQLRKTVSQETKKAALRKHRGGGTRHAVYHSLGRRGGRFSASQPGLADLSLRWKKTGKANCGR